MSLSERYSFRDMDIIAIIIALIIATIGIINLWSAEDYSLAMKQLSWLVISATIFMFIVSIDYMWFCRYAYLIYALCIALLIFTLFLPPPASVNARSWIKFGGFSVQPSEFAKVAMVIALARYLMYSANYKTVHGLIGPFVLTLLPMALILKQPDLGTAMIFLPTLFSILYVIGARKRHIFSVVGMGIVSLPILWMTVMRSYQKERVMAFANQFIPEGWTEKLGFSVDPNIYADKMFQLYQALIAIGSGGFNGYGWGQGPQTQRHLVPEEKADFIFTVICEEWGFVGALLLIVFFIVLFLVCLEIAQRTREPFGRIVALGCTALLSVQTFINLAVNVGFLPTTGLTLPFVSYGGSSLMASSICLGLIINVGMHQKRVLAAESFT